MLIEGVKYWWMWLLTLVAVLIGINDIWRPRHDPHILYALRKKIYIYIDQNSTILISIVQSLWLSLRCNRHLFPYFAGSYLSFTTLIFFFFQFIIYACFYLICVCSSMICSGTFCCFHKLFFLFCFTSPCGVVQCLLHCKVRQ